MPYVGGVVSGSSCEHCQEGATYSGAVISPNLGTTKMMRVPHAMSVSDCIAACCDLSGCDLSWMFGQRCYIISCQHKENCEPKKMENVKSYLTFVLRPSQRTVSLLEFGQVIPSMVDSVGLKNELSEEVSSLKELSVFGKDPSLEEIPEYIDDYETLEQDPFQVSIKHEQKESTDYGDWGPMVAGENSFNSSVDDGGDNQEDFAEKKGETGKVESLLNKNSSELSSVTERSIERRSSLPEIAPFHRRTSENRAAVQLLAQPDDALQKEVCVPLRKQAEYGEATLKLFCFSNQIRLLLCSVSLTLAVLLQCKKGWRGEDSLNRQMNC